jgi:hypothetical protein
MILFLIFIAIINIKIKWKINLCAKSVATKLSGITIASCTYQIISNSNETKLIKILLELR